MLCLYKSFKSHYLHPSPFKTELKTQMSFVKHSGLLPPVTSVIHPIITLTQGQHIKKILEAWQIICVSHPKRKLIWGTRASSQFNFSSNQIKATQKLFNWKCCWSKIFKSCFFSYTDILMNRQCILCGM